VEQLREWSTRRIEKVLERIPGDKLESLAISLEDMLIAAQSLTGNAVCKNQHADDPQKPKP
jgi:hypothetical protein